MRAFLLLFLFCLAFLLTPASAQSPQCEREQAIIHGMQQTRIMQDNLIANLIQQLQQQQRQEQQAKDAKEPKEKTNDPSKTE
jgi:hypothetical protein